MYPEDCVQSIIQPDPWWISNTDKVLCRGALILAFIPHVDQVPYTFEPVARTEATQHDGAIIRVTPLRINQPLKKTELPVAAMPLHSGEVWAAYRAKKRPCLIIGATFPRVAQSLTRGMAGHSTAPTVLAAPYYGAAQDGRRSGYKPDFVERIRHCEYPQFLWDKLPIAGPEESILRFDHLQPVGTHHNSYELSQYKLSDDALGIVDDLFQWMVWGGVPENNLIIDYREQIESTSRT